jgi:hypothetical protein
MFSIRNERIAFGALAMESFMLSFVIHVAEDIVDVGEEVVIGNESSVAILHSPKPDCPSP